MFKHSPYMNAGKYMLIFIALFLFSCEKEDATPTLDKQVIIRVNTIGVGNASNSTESKLVSLPGFNKMDYTGVDSIVLYAQIGSENPDNKATVQLFNFTDNVVIENSDISSTQALSANMAFISSKNIYSSLPGKRIDLGIRVTSERADLSVASGLVVMILYRK